MRVMMDFLMCVGHPASTRAVPGSWQEPRTLGGDAGNVLERLRQLQERDLAHVPAGVRNMGTCTAYACCLPGKPFYMTVCSTLMAGVMTSQRTLCGCPIQCWDNGRSRK